jgi:hypothetical protein
VVVDVGLSPVLLVDVLVGDVDVLNRRMVVLMDMGRQEVTPVLSTMKVVGDVVMLVPVP